LKSLLFIAILSTTGRRAAILTLRT
jgi:hypothetical protein